MIKEFVGHVCVIYMENMWQTYLENWRWHYSASRGTGQIQIWWIEVPETLIFMIYGFGGPVGSLICGFEYTDLFSKSKKTKQFLFK